jgi:hypothetical protein
MRKSRAIVCAVLIFGACRPHQSASSATSQNAIEALGSTVPSSRFDRTFWQHEHDANSSAWNDAKRLCGQTVLANYPNCLSVNDILQADQKKKAEAGRKAALRMEEMLRRGYQYDFIRKEWMPYHQMQSAGCWYADSNSNNSTRMQSFWQCPAGIPIPKGIPDPEFSKEEKDATD